MNKYRKEKNVTRLTAKRGSKCSSSPQAQEIPCHRTKIPGTYSLYPHWQKQGGQCKEKKRKKIFFNGQIIKIQGRRKLWGAVDWDPDRRALGTHLQLGRPCAQLSKNG